MKCIICHILSAGLLGLVLSNTSCSTGSRYPLYKYNCQVFENTDKIIDIIDITILDSDDNAEKDLENMLAHKVFNHLQIIPRVECKKVAEK